jgi:hypothetical protein
LLIKLIGTKPSCARRNIRSRRKLKMPNYGPLRNRSDRARLRSRKRSAAGKRLHARPRSRRLDLKPSVLSLRLPRNASVSCSGSWRVWTRILRMTKALSI